MTETNKPEPTTEPFWVHLDGPNGETEKLYVMAWDHIDARLLGEEYTGEEYTGEVNDREGWTVSDVRSAAS